MNELQLARLSLQLIKKDFLLEEDIKLAEAEPFERLHKRLKEIVSYLLDHDMNKLLNALYRIDVPEHTVNEILTASEPEEVAADLATAILNRERLKASYRLKFCS